MDETSQTPAARWNLLLHALDLNNTQACIVTGASRPSVSKWRIALNPTHKKFLDAVWNLAQKLEVSDSQKTAAAVAAYVAGEGPYPWPHERPRFKPGAVPKPSNRGRPAKPLPPAPQLRRPIHPASPIRPDQAQREGAPVLGSAVPVPAASAPSSPARELPATVQGILSDLDARRITKNAAASMMLEFLRSMHGAMVIAGLVAVDFLVWLQQFSDEKRPNLLTFPQAGQSVNRESFRS